MFEAFLKLAAALLVVGLMSTCLGGGLLSLVVCIAVVVVAYWVALGISEVD